MDMLGITELFPRLASIPSSRRRLILWLGLGALFFLACVESSLAILREQIAEADSALKLALAGESARVVTEASSSRIPVAGQAVLGFVLPWVLAMVAVPLEMLLDSGRFVLAGLAVIVLSAFGQLAHLLGRISVHASALLASLYDVYIALPLRLEGWVQNRRSGGGDDDDEPIRGAKQVAREGTA
jgi:hypothetical protein